MCLLQRLQLENGWNVPDVLLIICVFVVGASLLRLEKLHAMRVVLMTILMIGVPPVLFATKSVAYANIWTAHRHEMDDELVGPEAFQIATSLFYYAGPLLGIVLATIPVYGILAWSFETYLVQVLMTALHLLVTLQLGRVVAVVSRGNVNLVVSTLTFVLLFSFLFSSMPIASWKFPTALRWLVYGSINFWAMSGAIMNHFDQYDNSEDCHDFVTCMISDGRFIVYFMGFAQESNQFQSLMVLTGFFVILVGVEYQCLLFRRR